MLRYGESGSIVMIAGDGGERYSKTYYNTEWLAANSLQIDEALDQLIRAYQHKKWDLCSDIPHFKKAA
jgi:hypothetical protein